MERIFIKYPACPEWRESPSASRYSASAKGQPLAGTEAGADGWSSAKIDPPSNSTAAHNGTDRYKPGASPDRCSGDVECNSSLDKADCGRWMEMTRRARHRCSSCSASALARETPLS